MKRLILGLVVPVVLLCSCGAANSEKPEIAYPDFAGKWELFYMPGYTMPFEVMFAEKKPRLEFDTKLGTYKGFVMCNAISGTLEVPDSMRIRFGNPMKTPNPCEGKAEPSFLDALSRAEFYQWHSRDTLWLIQQNLLVMKLVRVRE